MENKAITPEIPEYKKEADLRDLILSIQILLRYLLKKWWVLLIALAIGAIYGIILVKTAEPQFEATSAFVLESSQSSGGLGGLAVLGISGMGKSNSGLFDETDNILWLYKTNNMLQKCLLTPGKREGKDVVMIDWFLDASKLRDEIKKSAPGLARLEFSVGDDFSNLSIEQNALINRCINVLKQKHFSIKKVEKTQNIISVSTKSFDEAFTKEFNEILVNTVNKYYVDTKTEKASIEVAYLEYKLDSFRNKMNSSMVQAAVASDNVPYPNPNQQILRVAPQRKTVDVQLESTMYAEIVRNLELSRMSLAKVTPLLQVVESPNYPLGTDMQDLKIVAIKWAIIAMLLTTVVLSVLHFYKKIMAGA